MPNMNSEFPKKIWPIILAFSKTKDFETAKKIEDSTCGFISLLKDKEETQDCRIAVATYICGDEVDYCSSGLIFLDDINSVPLDRIKSKKTIIDLTKLLTKLNEDFSRKILFSNSAGYYIPTIIFLLDGENDYLYNGIECIKKNKWYNNAMKVAVVYNDYSKNYDTIFELIDKNPEGFIQVRDTYLLKQLLYPISSASTMGYITKTETQKQDDLIGVDTVVDSIDISGDLSATKKDVTTKHKQVIAVPSKDKIHISGTYNLKKCQVSACEPDKANDDIVIIDTLHNGISVKNVSDMTLYTDRVVRSHDNRCFDYELGKNFSIDTRKDAFVSFDFNQDGKLIKIENMSDDDIDFVVELNEEPHFMQTNDVIFDFNGDVVLMVVDDNNSSETNIEWFENDFDDGGWD